MATGVGKQVARGAAVVFAVGAVVAAVFWAQGRYAPGEGAAAREGEPVAVPPAGGAARVDDAGEMAAERAEEGANGEVAPASGAPTRAAEGAADAVGGEVAREDADVVGDGPAGAAEPKRRVLLPSSKLLLAPDLEGPPEVELDPLPDAPPERRVFLPSSKVFLAPDLNEPVAPPTPDEAQGEGAGER